MSEPRHPVAQRTQQASREMVVPGPVGSGSHWRPVAQSPLEDIKSILPSFKTSSPAPSTSSPSSSISSWFSPSSASISPAHGDQPFALPDDPVVLAALSALAGMGLAAGGIAGYRRYWKRIRNANDVTGKMIDQRRWVRGVVTSVGDGDNFRLFHTPGPFYSLPLKIRSIPSTTKELKDQTLHIRISGVDAPENAHFGNPAQPHAKESLEWLKETITGRRMIVQLLRKDQYNRIVGVPYIHRRILPNKPLPVMMLKDGMAVVYESGGAEYGPWGLEGLKRHEAAAKLARRGLWGKKKFEHPAEYKKRMKLAEEGRSGDGGKAVSTPSKGLFGFIKRIFGAR